jgi:hypothetical protein
MSEKEEVKYYTPEIEEFHVGFEYEHNALSGNLPINYTKIIHSIDDNILDIFVKIEVTSIIRVKYLDQEDIESLGWIRKHEWEGNDEEQRYFITNEFTAFELKVRKESVSLYCTPIEFYGADGPAWYSIVTRINCKNKTELKRLIKNLDIL